MAPELHHGSSIPPFTEYHAGAVLMTVVCIAGMHRSGTSLVARLLHECGAYLGESSDLMPAAPDNPDGFWENVQFLAINDGVLSELGGAWDFPPPHDLRKAAHPELDVLRSRAQELVGLFSNQPFWAWKDPRNSLLLDFWLEVMPSLKVVTCLRNPIDVALSLRSRNKFSDLTSFYLWLAYTQHLLASLGGQETFVTPYDRYFLEPLPELRRLAEWLQVEVPQSALDRALGAISPFLRHSYSTFDELRKAPVPPALADLYSELLSVSARRNGVLLPGELPQHLIREPATLGSFAEGFKELDASIGAEAPMRRKVFSLQAAAAKSYETTRLLSKRLQEASHARQQLEARVADAEKAAARLEPALQENQRAQHQIEIQENTIQTLSQSTQGLATAVESLSVDLRSANAQLHTKEQILQQREGELGAIYSSRGWRALQAVLSIRLWLVPRGSGRERLFHYLLGPTGRSARPLLEVLLTPLRDWTARHPRVRKWARAVLPHRLLAKLRSPAQTAASIPSPIPSVSSQDDWQHYVQFAGRIRAAREDLRAAFVPEPPPMIRIADDDVAAAARSLRFSAVPSPTASIIVPVHGQARLTIECLLAIKRNTEGIAYEVIIVDDASDDATAGVLRSVTGTSLIRNSIQMGFNGSCNGGAAAAQGKYLIFLNNDTQVQGGWLHGLLQTFEHCHGVGAVGPKVVYPDGHLQEAGGVINADGAVEMVGLNDDPALPRYNYAREVDYVSGVCLALKADLFDAAGGFDPSYAPAYYEDVDLCLKIRQRGLKILYSPTAVVAHHLSASQTDPDPDRKLDLIAANRQTLMDHWGTELALEDHVKLIAFYLPQYHPIPENDLWWGKGFTEWRGVVQARPNFEGHYQPRLPADLGFYDLRIVDVMEQQAVLARRYGIDAFCYYYYWFGGKRLLHMPLERLLQSGRPDLPFCLCWANENWSRRWDGSEDEVLIAQQHSDDDDLAVIKDLARYLRLPNYLGPGGKPLLLVYRVSLFPDFKRTAAIWREFCRSEGIGDIELAMVDTFELSYEAHNPADYGVDACVQFPPHNRISPIAPPGAPINPTFRGTVADYEAEALKYSLKPLPPFTEYHTVMPGWDNTARRQDRSTVFAGSSPGAYQAWLADAIQITREQCTGDHRLVFINAWNEWAEANYIEPDQRYGHRYLRATQNAREVRQLT